jgi:hypothetical protein
MTWSRGLLWTLLSFTVPPTMQPPPMAPIPPGLTRLEGPLRPTWTKQRARIAASRVRLNGLGARTHANWILFQLPFASTQRERVRGVEFHVSASSPTDVGALRIGSVCVQVPASDSVDVWAKYTISGVGWTDRFAWHMAPPTSDPTVLGINVPTRVANWVACGRDDTLRDPATWVLEVTWEER